VRLKEAVVVGEKGKRGKEVSGWGEVGV